MDLNNYYLKVQTIDEAIKDLRQKRKELIEELIVEKHPLKIGDIVKCKGFAFKDKPMVVERVSVNIGDFEKPKWFAYGHIIKKDGTIGKQRGEWFQEITF